MKAKSLIIWSVLLSCLYIARIEAQTSVCINEIMQSNIDNLMENKDFPDSWVELYNPTDADVDLYGYCIGQDADLSQGTQWLISQNHNLVIPAGGYLLIYCDKEATGVHTDFRLESGKGNLYLFNRSGQTIDSLSYKKMPAANVAYGRILDGGTKWQYEVTPTPGAANNSVGAKNVLPDPVFSVAGGIMDSAVTLTVCMPTEDYPTDTRLYVTTNGQEPTKASPNGTSFTFNISQSTVVRAKLISDSALIARSVTHSYIFHPRDVTMPIVSIVTDSAYFYSDSIGIWMGQATDSMPNYNQDWRRPVNTEYFDADGNTAFNQLGETAIGGNYSKNLPQKSLKLYANKRFGTKRYEGAFWQDKPNVTSVKSFMLRNGGNNCQYARINDATIQTVFGTHVESLDWQAYQPVIVYINGQYKGEFGMRERSDEDYVESNYNGLEDIWQADAAVYYSTSAAFRKQFHFTDLYDAYMKQGVTYEELAQKMDMPNFMDALIAEMFAANIDYPHNNIFMWRPQEDGGKWRWILKDMDAVGFINNEHYNMFDYMFNYTSDVAGYSAVYARCHEIYTNVIAVPECKDMFIDRFATYLGDFLKPSVTLPLVDSMAADIQNELPDTYVAYNNFSNMATFNQWLNVLTSFYAARPMIVYDQMAKYFSLGRVFPMQIATAGCAVQMNDVPLTEGDFDGAYFENHYLRLKANTEDEVWQATLKHTDLTTDTLTFKSNDITVRLGNYAKDTLDTMQVSWELVKAIPDGIESVQTDRFVIGSTITIDSNWSVAELDGMTIDIVDNSGRVIRRLAPEELPVDVKGNIPSGVYFIHIITGTGNSYVEKFVVK